MKLAYIDPHPVPGLSPSTMQMLQTVDGLAQAGVDVTLITPTSHLAPELILGRELNSGVTVNHQFDFRKKWFFPFSTHKPFFVQAKKRIASGNFDALLVRNLKLADYLLRQNLEVPLYFETHEIFAQNFKEEHPDFSRRDAVKYKKLQIREHFVYNKASGIFALTSLLVDDIKRDYGAENTPFIVLPDGFDPVLAEKAHLRFQNEGRQAGPPRVLYLGSLHPWKGVATLLEAMVYVPAPVECWIAGGETDRIAELQARAEQLGIANRVKFLGKILPVDRFDLIAQSDICVLPLTESSIASRYTSPLKLFEYMAMGKSIVSADLPSIREVLVNGESGVLFGVGDAKAMSAAISLLVNEPELREKLGRRAYEEALSFSWNTRGDTIKMGLLNNKKQNGVDAC